MKFYANLITYFLICYLLIAFYGRFINQKEIFPFFHWSLYSSVPNKIEQPFLELQAIDNKEVNKIDLFSDKSLLDVNVIDANTVLRKYYNLQFFKNY